MLPDSKHGESMPTCLICESHDECQSDVESRDIAVIEVTDLPPDSCAPNRDRFDGNHMRPRAMGKTPSVTRYSVTRYEESLKEDSSDLPATVPVKV